MFWSGHAGLNMELYIKKFSVISLFLWLLFFSCPAFSLSPAFYTIQAGSFLEQENAQGLFDLIKQKSGLSFLRIEKRNGFYMVKVGRFGAHKEAQQALDRMRSISPDAYIIKEINLSKNVVRLYERPKPQSSVKTDKLRDEANLKKEKGIMLKRISRSINDGAYDDALDFVCQAVQKWPKTAEFHGYYGLVLLEKDAPDKALKCFRKSIMLSPDVAAYHNGAGYGLLFMDDPKGAAVEFNKALTLSPEFKDSLAGLGYAYIKLNRKEDALIVFDRLQKIDIEAANTLFRMIKNEFTGL